MTKRRPSALEALGDVAPPLPPHTTPEPTRQSHAARYNKPASYRLPEPLVEQLKQIAQTERVKISDLVAFALQRFVTDYEAGQITLPKSEAAHYNLNL